MPGFSTRLHTSPRLAAIERELKMQKAKADELEVEVLCNKKILRVKNSNETRFVMGMPDADSVVIYGLLWRYVGLNSAKE